MSKYKDHLFFCGLREGDTGTPPPLIGDRPPQTRLSTPLHKPPPDPPSLASSTSSGKKASEPPLATAAHWSSPSRERDHGQLRVSPRTSSTAAHSPSGEPLRPASRPTMAPLLLWPVATGRVVPLLCLSRGG
jgi:hypothetical protein